MVGNKTGTIDAKQNQLSNDINYLADLLVSIPETTKLSHLEENLRALDFNLSADEWKHLEDAVAAIPVTGDRYNAEQQKQVGL